MLASLIIFLFLVSSLTEKSYGQFFASEKVLNSATNHSNQITATLDQSSLINSNYTTFLSYSLAGNFQEASIQLIDENGQLIKEFSVEPSELGAITVQARLLHEGTYKMQMIVDGRTTVVHDLRVVR